MALSAEAMCPPPQQATMSRSAWAAISLALAAEIVAARE
jgi:hypothetical protein